MSIIDFTKTSNESFCATKEEILSILVFEYWTCVLLLTDLHEIKSNDKNIIKFFIEVLIKLIQYMFVILKPI